MLRRAVITFRNITKSQRNLKSYSIITCNRFVYPAIAASNKINFLNKNYSSSNKPTEHVVDSVLDQVTYERVCSETLDAINDYFEQLLESTDNLPGSDISYSVGLYNLFTFNFINLELFLFLKDGVLTVKLGTDHGTYVINRQTPNRQIWLSSPTTGRFDFVGPSTAETGKWVYRHTDETLHQLLQHELQMIFKEQKVEFEDLPFGR